MAERYAFVETFMAGASATRVESLITERVENALREVPEVKSLKSTSRAGHSLVSVELIDAVTKDEVSLVWSEVRDKLSDTEKALPTEASSPDLEIKSPVAVTLAVAITSDNTPLSVLERIATELQSRLSTLSGTRETEIIGEPNQEILVEIEPRALARLNLTIADISRLVGLSDTKVSAGEFTSEKNALVVEVKGELDSVERIGSIPITSQDNGRFLRLSDIATINKKYVSPVESISLTRGKRSILVATTMETGRRIDLWVADAKSIVSDYKAELPEMVNFEFVIDQNHYTNERLASLLTNLLLAISLVLISLFFLMGYRSALIIGAALPLTIAIVLVGLSYLSIPLHQMSVTGLIIALGLLIDNAIVVVEEYKIQRSRGHAYSEAIAESISHLFVPLLASTATTAFAFLPIAFTPGGIGDFTGAMAIAVVLSVSASFILAMTIIPSIAGMIDRRFPLNETNRSWWHVGITPPLLSRWYRRSLTLVFKKPIMGILLSLVLPIFGFAVAGTMTSAFFPPVDRNQFQVQLNLPSNVSIEETRARVNEVQAILDELPEISESHWFIGEGAPAVYYNMLANNNGIASFANAWVTTKDVDDPRKIMVDLQKRFMEAFPDTRIMALPFEQGPPFSAPIEIRVTGPDLNKLKGLGEKLRLILSITKDVTYSTATLSGSVPQVSIYPNENMARHLGLSTKEIPRQISDELNGLIAGTVMEGSTEIPIKVRMSDALRSSLSDLSTLPIQGEINNGSYGGIPLEQIASIRLDPAPTRIDRHENQRVNTVSGFLLPYAFPSLAVEDFRKRLAEQHIELPEGYKIEFGGEEEERGEAVSNIMATFITFLSLMVAVIVLSLNSFRYAGIIGLVGFLSIGLAFFGVWLSGYPRGYTSLIGTLGLIGLAINGAIIILSALKANSKAVAGDVNEGVNIVMESSRHIVSTTITTIAGFLPLILFGGHFWPPLAMAIAGGVAGSAVLALYLVPALFSYYAIKDLKKAEQAEISQLTEAASLT